MKRLTYFLSALAFAGVAVSCNSDAADKIASNDDTEVSAEMVDSEGTPAFSFEEEVYDFGTLTKGDNVTHDFVFTNTGDAPLIITNAQGSCGCTVPNPPKEPIQPGEKSVISVSFSANAAGRQDKTVTIDANTVPSKTILRISATVNDPEAGAAAEG